MVILLLIPPTCLTVEVKGAKKRRKDKKKKGKQHQKIIRDKEGKKRTNVHIKRKKKQYLNHLNILASH